MKQTRFKYSMKNIPIPSRNSYLKKLIEKTESVIKRMRWKAFFFENSDSNEDDGSTNNKFGFKSVLLTLLLKKAKTVTKPNLKEETIQALTLMVQKVVYA